MKKYLISLLLFITFFTISNQVYAAKDLSRYFEVTDFRFCEDVVVENGRFICNSEKKEYTNLAEAEQSEDDNKVCNLGSSSQEQQFASIIDWTFDYESYDGTIESGDYVSIPLFRNRYEEVEYNTSKQQLIYSGGVGETDLYVNGIKIGTWKIINSSSRTLYMQFSDGINDPSLTSSISGQFKTARNFYFSSTHKSTRDITISIETVNNPISKEFCISQTTPSTETTSGFSAGVSSTSNNYASYLLLSNRGTFKKLCEAFNNNSEVPDSNIYDNLILEVNLGKNIDYGINITARIDGLYIPNLPDIFTAVGSGGSSSILSFFYRR